MKGNLANVPSATELPSSATISYSSAGDGLNVLYDNDPGGPSLVTKYDGGVPGGYTCEAGKTPAPPSNLNCNWFSTTNSGKGRHGEGGIYMLTDGHTKYLKGGSVSAGANAASAADNQPTTQTGTVPQRYRAAGTSGLGNFGVTYSVK